MHLAKPTQNNLQMVIAQLDIAGFLVKMSNFNDFGFGIFFGIFLGIFHAVLVWPLNANVKKGQKCYAEHTIK